MADNGGEGDGGPAGLFLAIERAQRCSRLSVVATCELSSVFFFFLAVCAAALGDEAKLSFLRGCACGYLPLFLSSGSF